MSVCHYVLTFFYYKPSFTDKNSLNVDWHRIGKMVNVEFLI